MLPIDDPEKVKGILLKGVCLKCESPQSKGKGPIQCAVIKAIAKGTLTENNLFRNNPPCLRVLFCDPSKCSARGGEKGCQALEAINTLIQESSGPYQKATAAVILREVPILCPNRFSGYV